MINLTTCVKGKNDENYVQLFNQINPSIFIPLRIIVTDNNNSNTDNNSVISHTVTA